MTFVRRFMRNWNKIKDILYFHHFTNKNRFWRWLFLHQYLNKVPVPYSPENVESFQISITSTPGQHKKKIKEFSVYKKKKKNLPFLFHFSKFLLKKKTRLYAERRQKRMVRLNICSIDSFRVHRKINIGWISHRSRPLFQTNKEDKKCFSPLSIVHRSLLAFPSGTTSCLCRD